jgi:class 3 adenylate cyclase/tetratricopeptide (TPR) repeat protein
MCGTPVTAGGAPSRFTSPESYTPKHLAEQILTSKAALEGERKQVTVLFADLKGSMELLADRGPEEARKILDPVLDLMMEAVHRYEGTVNQVMGDGIMALFGAPLAHEDHAVRACYAALRMQDSVKRYADEVRHRQEAAIRIRVGLNSGEVVVRAIGGDLHMDYTAVGQTTHLAGRMEQLADPGAILLTAETVRLAEGYVEVKPLGPIPVKGLARAMDIYQLLRADAVSSRLHAAAARGLSTFVGRDTELAQLHEALDRASGGHGQVVAVVGEPGVGKSRLCWEFTHSHGSASWLICEASSVSYGKAMAYLPVIDLLKSYFRIEGHDDRERIREKVTGKLLARDRQLEPWLPALLSLLDVPVDDPQWERLDPTQRRQQVLDGIRRLLLHESQIRPVLIFVEDLHWIDSETQALLDGLIESLPSARVLLLVSYRPEYLHGWARKTYYRHLRIDPLPSKSAAALLASLLGLHPSLEPLKRRLAEWTEGNPLFLEESVRTLIETGVLVGAHGALLLAKDVTQIHVPASLEALLAARIDRLAPEDKRLLQAAAVIGKDVPLALLQAVAELEDDSLTRGLARLQAAEFLYEIRLFPDLEYTFKHALTHEVAYSALLQDRRRALHVRIVEAMEHLYANRPAEQLERLAHHALAGGDWRRAVLYLGEAGAKASLRYAKRDSVACCEQALAALAHLPESRQTREQAAELRFNLAHSLFSVGQLPRAKENFLLAETLAGALDDHRLLAQINGGLTYLLGSEADFEAATRSGLRALTIATSLGDLGLEVWSSVGLGRIYFGQGNYRAAIERMRWVTEALKDMPVDERFGRGSIMPSVTCRAWLALGLGQIGECGEAIARGGEGVRIADEAAGPLEQVWAYYCLASVHLERGDASLAIRLLERAVPLCAEGRFPIYAPRVLASLGAAHTMCGRLDAALPLLEQAAAEAQAIKQLYGHPLSLIHTGEAHLAAGRLGEARRYTAQALEDASRQGARGDQARAHHLLGDVASRDEPSDSKQALENYAVALSLAEELGMVPLQARCHLGLARLDRRTGKREQAQEHFTIATTMYREMDMRFWLEQAEAESKEPGA